MVKNSDSKKACFWIPPPQSSGWEIQKMCKMYSTKSIPVNKMERFERPIFLRSPTLEYEKKTNTEEGLPKNFCKSVTIPPKKEIINKMEYTPFTKLKVDCPPNYRAQTLNPYTYAPIGPWEPQPQFWYDAKSAQKGPTWPVGNPNDYSYKGLESQPTEDMLILNALEIECPERYIPGEIYKNKVPKEPIADLRGTGGCTPVWVPKNELFNKKLDPLSLPPQPKMSDFAAEAEAIQRAKLLPPDKSLTESSDSFEELMRKLAFKQPEESKKISKNGNLPYQAYMPHNPPPGAKPCCDMDPKSYCKDDKYIFSSERECSCCNSKYV